MRLAGIEPAESSRHHARDHTARLHDLVARENVMFRPVMLLPAAVRPHPAPARPHHTGHSERVRPELVCRSCLLDEHGERVVGTNA